MSTPTPSPSSCCCMCSKPNTNVSNDIAAFKQDGGVDKTHNKLTLTKKRKIKVPPVKAHDMYLNQNHIKIVGTIVWRDNKHISLIKHLDDHLDQDLGFVLPTY